jgi:hypothetical protein
MTRSEFTESAEAIREEKRAQPGGWLALMAVDLRVVAVKLTNRFRGARSRRPRGGHVRVIKARRGARCRTGRKEAGRAGEGGEKTWGRDSGGGWRRAGSVGGQEIAVKQAWRGIKG